MNYQQLFLSFQGRISRSSYWTAWIVFFGINILVSLVGTRVIEGTAGGFLILLACLVIGYSSLAVAAKRWHDRDKSGWWSLVALVPVIGVIWMFVENGFLPGTRGPNRFGPDPIKPALPVAVTYDGQTYYRHSNGDFTDRSGNLVRGAALLGALGAAYVAMSATNTWDGYTNDHTWDTNSTSSDTNSDSSTDASEKSGGWGWFSGGGDGGGDSGGDTGGDSGGGGGGD